MASRRFLVLDRRVRALEHLLPRLSPLGRYSNRQYDRTRAYLVLCHAEIEGCFEDLVWDIADRGYQRWRHDGRASVALVALLSYHQGSLGAVLESLTRPPRRPPPTLDARVDAVHASYRDSVKNNHGIKEKNLLRLLLPIGVRETQLPVGWLQDMNTLGAERGVAAHQTGHRVRQPPDAARTRSLVQAAVSGLGSLDTMLVALRA